jgi:thiamine biosynthesis lipoprotein
MRNKSFWVIVCLGLILFVWYRAYSVDPGGTTYQESRSLMGTFVRLQICSSGLTEPKIKQKLKPVWDRLRQIEAEMSAYRAQSAVSRINRSYPDAVAVSAGLYRLLQESVRLSQATQGAFDVTVKPLIDLWDQKARAGQVPSQKEIQKVRTSVGMDQLILKNGRKVRLAHPGTAIDLGAIAKGFAVDEAACILKKQGFDHFYIDAGGDLYLSGFSCRDRAWRIGVRDPRDKTKVMEVLHITDSAITTSGDYEQFYTIAGKRYSHIIDPKTGHPEETVVSATVIAPHAIEADALSTALCVLEPKEGIRLVNALGKGYAALMVTLSDDNDLQQWKSQKFDQYLQKQD